MHTVRHAGALRAGLLPARRDVCTGQRQCRALRWCCVILIRVANSTLLDVSVTIIVEVACQTQLTLFLSCKSFQGEHSHIDHLHASQATLAMAAWAQISDGYFHRLGTAEDTAERFLTTHTLMLCHLLLVRIMRLRS